MSSRPLSLFAQKMQKLRESKSSSSETHSTETPKSLFGDRSYVLQCSEADSIHRENVNLLSNMSESEIEERRKELMQILSNTNVEFLKKKRITGEVEADLTTAIKCLSTRESRINDEQPTCSGIQLNKDLRTNVLIQPSAVDVGKPYQNDIKRNAGNESNILELKNSYVHMEKVETEKLKWMEDVPITKPFPDTLYNARFDFQGNLLPYIEEDKSTCDRGLYHHGDEPQRPGYSIEELYQLTRSSLPSQKVFALNTLAAILEKEFILSLYLETELLNRMLDSGIFLILRFSMDERLKTVYLAALRAMSALLWRPLDMHYLSDIVGIFDDIKLPSFGINNEAMIDETLTEMKDIELINLDVIRGCLRTDLIHRFRYIMDDSLLEVDHYLSIIKCLIRISYHSEEAVHAVMDCPSLLETLFVNCQFSMKSRKLYTAKLMILFRVICCRTPICASMLTNRLTLLPFLLTTVSNPVTMTTTTSQCIQLWHVLLHHQIGVESVSELSATFCSLLQQLLALQMGNLDEGLITLGNALLSLLIFLFDNFRASVQFLLPTVERLSCQWINVIANEKEVSRNFVKLVSNSIFFMSRFALMTCSFHVTVEWYLGRQDVRQRLTSPALRDCSFLLHAEKKNYAPSLPSLCVPASILGTNNSLILVHSLVKYFKKNPRQEFASLFVDEIWINYVIPVLDHNLSEIASLWPARFEISLLNDLLFFSFNQKWETDEKPKQVLKLAFALLRLIHIDDIVMVKNILNGLIFENNLHTNANFIDDNNRRENLTKVKEMFIQRLSLPENDSSIMSSMRGTECVLPTDWFYIPILEVSNKFMDNNVRCEQEVDEMRAALRWIHLIECIADDVETEMSLSTRFCRVCCIFFCGDVFLEIKEELSDILKEMLKHNDQLEFKKPIPGVSSFYDFFRELCEHYTSSSYGDPVFSTYLLVPLQQKHDVRLRQYLWNEQTVVFRFLRLTQQQLPIPFKYYLQPCETNVQLIETYLNNIATGRVEEERCPVMYSIALHHVANFIRLYTKETVANRLKQKINSIGNEYTRNKFFEYN